MIAISSVDLSTGSISSVDYYDGKILLSSSVSTGTVTFLYSDRCKSSSLYVDAVDPGTLTIYDILNIRGSLIANSMRPDVVIVHPVDLPDIFLSQEAAGNAFIPSKQYANKEDLLAGEVGQIVDLKLLSSLYAPEGVAIVADSKRLGWDIIKRDLTGTAEVKPEKDQTWYHLWAEREFAVSDDSAIGVVVNIKKNQYKASDL
jgi:hypothetical protein